MECASRQRIVAVAQRLDPQNFDKLFQVIEVPRCYTIVSIWMTKSIIFSSFKYPKLDTFGALLEIKIYSKNVFYLGGQILRVCLI